MNLINTLRMYAEDMHSATGYSERSSAMSKAADYIERLEKERDQLIQAVADHVTARCELAAQNEAMREALHKLACLGNGDQFGNSVGNTLAQEALNLPNLAQDVGEFFAKETIKNLEKERDTLAAQNEALREALEGVMRWQVKNVEVWNNSAYDNAYRTRAALPYLAAEVLRKRDAETLRRAAEKLKVGEVWISRVAVSAALRLMAAELEKETACPAEASAAAPTRPAEALTKKGA